jgi:hypothetical protein
MPLSLCASASLREAISFTKVLVFGYIRLYLVAFLYIAESDR